MTGLSDDAINTLIKLKSGKYYNQHKFDYALHTLNIILSTYENANFFELIYHFLFGNYDTMGHYDEIGRVIYDGSEVFVSDKYNANQLTINSSIVNKAVLQLITEQLEVWKKSLENKKDDYGKLLPSKEKLLYEIEDKYKNIEYQMKSYLELQENYNKLISEDNIDFNKLYNITQALIIHKNALDYSYKIILDLKYTLKGIYSVEYQNKTIDDFFNQGGDA